MSRTEPDTGQPGNMADEFMSDAIQYIDRQFGKGTALKHPSLVVAHMQASAAGYLGFCISQGTEIIADAIASSAGYGRVMQ